MRLTWPAPTRSASIAVAAGPSPNLPSLIIGCSRHSMKGITRIGFLLLTRDQCQSLGCLYIRPLLPFLERAQAAAEVIARFSPSTAMITFWLRQATS
jgi:hypothetical protein